MVTQDQVLAALGRVQDPELHRDIVSLGMVRGLVIEGGSVRFTLALTTAACPLRGPLTQQAREAVAALPGVDSVDVATAVMTDDERQKLFAGMRQQREQQRPRPSNSVHYAIAVMSGKGGVGKSLVTAMLAVSLRRQGMRVGILDADITGPSVPRMFFAANPRPKASEEGLLPVESRGGIKVMSINLLLPRDDDAVIWRGPLVSGAIRQFWEEVVWGELDYLLIDLPPGTSDAALTVLQSIPLNGVLLVTSPQGLAGMVVRKAASMVNRVNVPILGVIENMAYVVCPCQSDGSGSSDHRLELFGPSHADELIEALGTDLLGRLPIDPALTALADSGRIEQFQGDAFAPILERLHGRVPEEQSRPQALSGS